jgi:acetyl-CoA synthetase
VYFDDQEPTNLMPHSTAYDVRQRFEQARVQKQMFEETYTNSIQDSTAYWQERAINGLHWRTPFQTVQKVDLSPNNVSIRWFEEGTLNVCEQCVDRHLPEKANDVAIIWEADDPNEAGRTLTYGQLHEEVQRCATMLLALGASSQHPITIYMPMVPEAVVAMLACARLGVPHSVVFGGFSPKSLRDRVVDCDSRIIITADEARRGGKRIPLKQFVDEAIEGLPVTHVVTLQHTKAEVNMQTPRDVYWHTLMEEAAPAFPAIAVESEHPLFILYTSGSTGKPKGLQHSSAGYLLYAQETFLDVFDYKAGEIFWCTADVGWITGHSYMVYGPLAAGATTLLFEGIPTYPDISRFWHIIEKHRVNLFYTAPTAIRLLMKEGDAPVAPYDLSSLRVMGSVGEPINPEAWLWYFNTVGKGRCAVVDTYWQTETGGHVLTPLPGVHKLKPGFAMHPYFGIQAQLMNEAGQPQPWKAGERISGALCLEGSWPGQARTIWGDHQRFQEVYFAPYPGYYFTGDVADRDEQGHYRIEGRMDDVINVSGHRLGTAEIEAALAQHAYVAEAAVVGVPHDVKGQGISAFVTLKAVVVNDDTLSSEAVLQQSLQLLKELNAVLRQEIGAIANLETLQLVVGLPKTRSGKIMRRILRKIATGEVQTEDDIEKLGDISTLIDPTMVKRLLKH